MKPLDLLHDPLPHLISRLAGAALKAAWETGDPQAVSVAMAKFRSDNVEYPLEHSSIPKGDKANALPAIKDVLSRLEN